MFQGKKVPVGATWIPPYTIKRVNFYGGLQVEAVRIMGSKYQFEPVFINMEASSHAGGNGSYDLVRETQ